MLLVVEKGARRAGIQGACLNYCGSSYMLKPPVATVGCGQEMLSKLERIWVKFLQKAEM